MGCWEIRLGWLGYFLLTEKTGVQIPYLPPKFKGHSSSRQGYHSFKVKTGVRAPYALPNFLFLLG